jgi:ribonuclease BN (tRNA processing enzyme)
MPDDLRVRILGDFGPFSHQGKNIGYLLHLGASNFILDCGAPLFQQIGGHGLKEVEGVIITHAHEDHKRWLGDLAIFGKYAPDIQRKVRLLTTQSVYPELRRAVAPALTTTLSFDAKTVVDVPFEEFIEFCPIGPRAKYLIATDDNSDYLQPLQVVDRTGAVLPPDRAKVVVHPRTKRARLLFKDPIYQEWIEPDTFYPFSSRVFYEDDQRVYTCRDGSTIAAMNAPVWHGIASTGIRATRGDDVLAFSADTVHDTALWQKLCGEKREQQLSMSPAEFAAATVIYGDINHYVERIWSKERYEDAVKAFDGAAVIHDVSGKNSVVHTDYDKLVHTALRRERTLLVHGPDRFTSQWPLCGSEKVFKVVGDTFCEVVGDRCYPMNADVYHKENGKYIVGYRCAAGGRTLYEKDGFLRFHSYDGTDIGTPLFNVELYEDVCGRYLPLLEAPDAHYWQRPDGRIELLRFGADGSRGEFMEDLRERLAGKPRAT